MQVPRPTFREVVRLDHAQGTSCTSYHKNFPTGKLGRQPPKYKDLQRSSGSLRIQIRNYVIFWRTWHSQQLYCRSQSLTLIPLALHAPQHGHLFVPAPRTRRPLRSQVDDSRHLGDISPTRLGVRSRSRRWRAQADLAGLVDQRPSTRSDAHTLSQTRSTRSIWTASYFSSHR